LPANDPATRSESLYFRGSAKLRENAEEYALGRGMTLSSALSLLVERGLEAAANERSVANLEQLIQQRSQELALMQERDRNWRAWADSIQGQLQTVRVGQCPSCKRVVTASDQFIMRRCPWSGCDDRLQQVLLATAGEFPPAIAGLVGALGGFLFGVAASQGGEADDSAA
jgi:hypothetical protein